MVLDLVGARSVDFVVGASPLTELLACLHKLAEPEHHPESRAWVGKVRDRMPAGLQALLDSFAPLWARYRIRAMYPIGPPLDRDLDAEFRELELMPEKLFLGLAAVAIRGTVSDTEKLQARPAAFIESCDRRSFLRGELARRLLADPHRFQHDLIEILGRCRGAFFDAEWTRIGPNLLTVADNVRSQLRSKNPAEVLAALSPTATVSGAGTSVSYDKLQVGSATIRGRGCLLIPTIHGWPHLIMKADESDLPVVVNFLAADWDQRTPVTQALLRERLAVLVEPGRWQLIRHLISESITTTELAHRTGLTLPQVSRHLKRLREVGLVTSTREGRMVHHRLHTQVLLRLGSDVLATVIR